MRKISGIATMVVAGTLALSGPLPAETASASSCMRGPYMVFFDAGSATLTMQGKAILDNVVNNYRLCESASVVISGHTDRNGAAQANVKLSRRIASGVRNYLVAQGIPKGVLTTEAYGESRPLVETADGVREPENRRAEITFGPGSGW